jgi:hypothetical protein
MSSLLAIVHIQSPLRLLFRASKNTLPKIIILTAPTPPLNDQKSCERCGRIGHTPAFCKAKYDTGGYPLDNEEEPIPQKVY